MAIYLTGDTHGNFSRLVPERFAKPLTRDDLVIICGDFGGVWDGVQGDRAQLDALEDRPWTTAFVCGNHENFDELYSYPVVTWQGGHIHRIRPHVFHLMRGQIFTLEKLRFFVMGGARSLDIWDGLLDPEAPDFDETFWALTKKRAVFRVKHLDWWEEELPTEEEYATARENLARCDWQTDVVLTHCAPDHIQDQIVQAPHDPLTHFLEELSHKLRFTYWFFGHYHRDVQIDERYMLLYQRILRLC